MGMVEYYAIMERDIEMLGAVMSTITDLHEKLWTSENEIPELPLLDPEFGENDDNFFLYVRIKPRHNASAWNGFVATFEDSSTREEKMVQTLLMVCVTGLDGPYRSSEGCQIFVKMGCNHWWAFSIICGIREFLALLRRSLRLSWQ